MSDKPEYLNGDGSKEVVRAHNGPGASQGEPTTDDYLRLVKKYSKHKKHDGIKVKEAKRNDLIDLTRKREEGSG